MHSSGHLLVNSRDPHSTSRLWQLALQGLYCPTGAPSHSQVWTETGQLIQRLQHKVGAIQEVTVRRALGTLLNGILVTLLDHAKYFAFVPEYRHLKRLEVVLVGEQDHEESSVSWVDRLESEVQISRMVGEDDWLADVWRAVTAAEEAELQEVGTMPELQEAMTPTTPTDAAEPESATLPDVPATPPVDGKRRAADAYREELDKQVRAKKERKKAAMAAELQEDRKAAHLAEQEIEEKHKQAETILRKELDRERNRLWRLEHFHKLKSLYLKEQHAWKSELKSTAGNLHVAPSDVGLRGRFKRRYGGWSDCNEQLPVEGNAQAEDAEIAQEILMSLYLSHVTAAVAGGDNEAGVEVWVEVAVAVEVEVEDVVDAMPVLVAELEEPLPALVALPLISAAPEATHITSPDQPLAVAGTELTAAVPELDIDVAVASSPSLGSPHPPSPAEWKPVKFLCKSASKATRPEERLEKAAKPLAELLKEYGLDEEMLQRVNELHLAYREKRSRMTRGEFEKRLVEIVGNEDGSEKREWMKLGVRVFLARERLKRQWVEGKKGMLVWMQMRILTAWTDFYICEIHRLVEKTDEDQLQARIGKFKRSIELITDEHEHVVVEGVRKVLRTLRLSSEGTESNQLAILLDLGHSWISLCFVLN